MRFRFPPLLALTLLAAAFAGTPRNLAAQEAGVHQVVISLNPETGALQYSLNPVVAFPGERVVFSAPGMDSWTVTFQGATPFANREISGTGEDVRNVPILPAAAAGTYKYDVSVTVGGRTVTEDPEIIVRPPGEGSASVR